MAEYLASKVIKVAQSQIGTTDGGNNNVKYNDWADNGKDAWCQVFIDWCFDQAYGSEIANTLLCGQPKTVSTMASKNALRGLIDQ